MAGPRTASPWPFRFMILTGVVIIAFAAVAFGALMQSEPNFGLAFPLFAGIVALILFEVVLMVINNRQQR